MSLAISPGTYLRLRREAAGLSLLDVAGKLPTEPRWPQHERKELLRLVEADVQPATFLTIVQLRQVYAFDFDVLVRLVLIGEGEDLPAPRLCGICACSEHDACFAPGSPPCSWAAADQCTACQLPDRSVAA